MFDSILNKHRQWRMENPHVRSQIRPVEPSDIDEWMREFEVDLGGAILWCDDESNYAGVYCQGPLTGMVFVLVHDAMPNVPMFQTPEEFIDRVFCDDEPVWDLGSMRWYQVGTLPPRQLEGPLLKTRTSQALQLLDHIDFVDDEDDYRSFAAALALLPKHAVPAVVLERLWQLFKTDKSAYLWQDIPEVLVANDFRECGLQIAQALELARNMVSRSQANELIRAAVPGP